MRSLVCGHSSTKSAASTRPTERKSFVAMRRQNSPTTNGSPNYDPGSAFLADPAPRVAEHLHPRRVFAEARRAPGVLDAPEAALGVRHEDGEAAIGRSQAGNTLR